MLMDDTSSLESFSGTPCVLQASMKEQTTKKVINEKRKHLAAFMDAMYTDLVNSGIGSHCLPDMNVVRDIILPRNEVEEMLGDPQPDNMDIDKVQGEHTGAKYTFPPTFDPKGLQSPDSYKEQTSVLEMAKDTINCYQNGLSHKNIIVCGGPGNGKTTVCEQVCLYALSRGLRGLSTSIVADRSKALGGIHVHLLCAIPASERNNISPGRAAEAAIMHLYRKPALLYLWQQLNFLYIYEFGAVSAEMFATIDIISRYIKQSNSFLGGLLCICSMDIHQLLPIQGTPLMLSTSVMTDFSFVELKESVRAAHDENLRKLCDLSRTMSWTQKNKQKFKEIIMENCNFVPSFDSPEIPDDAIYIFGRKAPCQKIEELLIKRIQGKDPHGLVLSVSQDEESSVAGNWKVASFPVSQQLSRILKEKRELYLFKNGRYEFTHNKIGSFQQGQLAILLEVTKDDVKNHLDIEFYKGPPGCKQFPPLVDFTKDRLSSLGWKTVKVSFDQSNPRRIRGSLIGRREQYGVRLRVASTIHASQGATLGTVVTAISNSDTHKGVNFALWDKAQAVVLISRTHRCADLYFVGDPEAVANELLLVMTGKTSRWLPRIRHVTDQLCGIKNSTPIIERTPIFGPCDFILHRQPAVYLLVLTKCYGYMYIGQTKDIRERLNDHNCGRGTTVTNNQNLRPWALFGYLYGFGAEENRVNFEQQWKYRVRAARGRFDSLSATGVLDIGRELAMSKNRFRSLAEQIRVQQCGYMEQKEEAFDLVDDT